MKGTTHRLIANIALACLEMDQRHVLYPRWQGIESGATLTDEFRAYWDKVGPDGQSQLVHRCYIDSDKKKHRGSVFLLENYTTRSIGFVEAFLDGQLEGAYTEVSFLENFGMYLGIISHHLCDLCTPVHVGHKLDYEKLGYKSYSRFHQKLERDIARYAKKVEIALRKPKRVALNRNHFLEIAQKTYENQFLDLEKLYMSGQDAGIVNMCAKCINDGIRHTVDIWYTILKESKITDHDWTREQLWPSSN